MSRAASHIWAQSEEQARVQQNMGRGWPGRWRPHESASMHAWWQSVAAAIATPNRSPARVAAEIFGHPLLLPLYTPAPCP